MCHHEYIIKGYEIYYDYFANKVIKVIFKCKICGKERIKKFW